MKLICKNFLWLGLAVMLLGVPCWAQPSPPPGSMGGRYPRLYDPQKVETLTGKIMAVNRITPRKPGRPVRLELQVETGQGPVAVMLGPASYVEQQGMQLAVGDQVEVKGVRITRPRKLVFMAGEVIKGNQVLPLRDSSGRPLWAARKLSGIR